jgi:hypothetical protein
MTDEQIEENGMKSASEYVSKWEHKLLFRDGFIAGAKWVQSQITDEKLRKIANHIVDNEMCRIKEIFDYLKKELA